MDIILGILAGGLVLGLAGSLHCACMCGGIASGALFLIDPRDKRERLITLVILQAGRITTYALAGAAVAGIVSIAIDPATTALSFRILQWLGAFTLMWMGLATAGMLPRLAIPGGGSLATGSTPGLVSSRLTAKLRAYPRLSAYAMGLTWGLTPCPMVYAALMSATLAGSASMGALWMAGFGAGTLPGVLGAALGVSALSRARKGPAAEMTAGLLVAAFGFATLYFGITPSHLFCRPQ